MDFGYAISMNWGELTLLDLIGRLGLATILGLMIGIERERLERAAGMRTHALVSVASALIMIVSTYGFPIPESAAAGTLDPSRIAAQVVSGVGFLGAGVIFMRRNTVRGLTTAASIWAVCGIGLAAGGGLYVAAGFGAAFMLLIQGGMRPVERRLFRHQAIQHRIIVVSTGGVSIFGTIQQSLIGTVVRLKSIDFDRKESTHEETVQLTVQADSMSAILEFVDRLQSADGVRKVRWKQGASQLRGPGRVGISDARGDEEEDDDDDENAELKP
ncbi:MAG: MgtC/SapB family protein [Thermomicrobiales bacterium]